MFIAQPTPIASTTQTELRAERLCMASMAEKVRRYSMK